MTKDAERVLRDILERGLVEVWRYHVPEYLYGDMETQFPYNDYRIAEKELWKIVEHPDHKILARTETVFERQYAKNGVITTETGVYVNDDEDDAHIISVQYDIPFNETPDSDGYIYLNKEKTYHWIDAPYSEFVSDYLNREDEAFDDCVIVKYTGK